MLYNYKRQARNYGKSRYSTKVVENVVDIAIRIHLLDMDRHGYTCKAVS